MIHDNLNVSHKKVEEIVFNLHRRKPRIFNADLLVD